MSCYGVPDIHNDCGKIFTSLENYSTENSAFMLSFGPLDRLAFLGQRVEGFQNTICNIVPRDGCGHCLLNL
jgi:hypothetical protein